VFVKGLKPLRAGVGFFCAHDEGISKLGEQLDNLGRRRGGDIWRHKQLGSRNRW